MLIAQSNLLFPLKYFILLVDFYILFMRYKLLFCCVFVFVFVLFFEHANSAYGSNHLLSVTEIECLDMSY